ncbi:MAG: GumC family protein [Hyphomicrobiaceae bacterium]|nr:GumC family protein [Hyphomicrobiaceae bacterium]
MYQSATPAVSDDIEIAALLRAISRRKLAIAVLAITAGVLTYVALSFVTPLYSSQARIIIEREDNSFTRPTASATSPSNESQLMDKEAVSSQVQVLLSRDLAKSVVKELKLDEDPEFNKDVGRWAFTRLLSGIFSSQSMSPGEALQERVVDAFLDRLSVYQVEGSRVIAVNFESRNPQTAAKVANTLAENYLTWQQSEKLRQTKQASAWLNTQIKDLTKKVEQADIKAEKFRSSSGLLQGRNNTSLDSQQLSELNSQLILAKAKRTEAEARAALIQKMLKEQGDVDNAADVLNSRLIQRLLEQRIQVQRTLAELSATLLPSHPRIKQLNSELADLRRQIRQEARKVVSSLESEAQIAGARERSLRESLAQLKTSASKANENQIRLRALEREASANREVLESYLTRYREATTRSDTASVPAHASIISHAHVANKPSFPKKGPLALLAAAAVALLGVAYVVARELIAPEQASMNPGMPHRSDYTGAPSTYDVPAQQPDHPGYVTLKTPASLGGAAGRHGIGRVLLIPAGTGYETAGQTLGAARSICATGRSVILVDALAQGDHVALALGLPESPGVGELQSGAANFETAIRRDPGSELHVISGTLTPRQTVRLQGPALGRMLAALEAAYDVVAVYVDAHDFEIVANLPSRMPTGAVIVTGSANDDDEAHALADRVLDGGGPVQDVYVIEQRSRAFPAFPQLPFTRRASAA